MVRLFIICILIVNSGQSLGSPELGMEIIQNYMECTTRLNNVESNEFRELQLTFTLLELSLRKLKIPEHKEHLAKSLTEAFHAKCVLELIYITEEGEE